MDARLKEQVGNMVDNGIYSMQHVKLSLETFVVKSTLFKDVSVIDVFAFSI